MNGGFMERSCAESQNGGKHQRYGLNSEGTTALQTMKEHTMLNRYKKAAVVIALTGATAITGLAYAQESSPARNAGPVATQAAQGGRAAVPDNWLNLGQIYDKLVAAGYTDVREIERERDGYEAKARNSEGRAFKVYIDPVDGRIVREKSRDRDGKRDRGERGDRDGSRAR